MLEKKDIIELGIEEEKANQALEIFGDKINNLTTESNAKARVSKVYSDLDLAILNGSKIPKLSDEKTTDYYKRVDSLKIEAERESVKKELNDTIRDLNGQIETLKESAKGKGDESTKKLIKELEEERDQFKEKAEKVDSLLDGKESEWSEKYSKLDNDFNSFKRTTELKYSIPNKFKDGLTKKFIDFEINEAIKTASEKYDIIEKNEKGETVLKDSNLNEPSIKASEYFANQLKDIIDTGVTQQGGGAGNTEPPQQKEIQVPENATDREKIQLINEHLAKNGVSKLDDDYDEKFDKLQIQLGLKEEQKK